MMFSDEDFKIDSLPEFFQFLPMLFFLGLVGPFLLAGYSIGFLLNLIGLYD